jgi:hypothetical protein
MIVLFWLLLCGGVDQEDSACTLVRTSLPSLRAHAWQEVIMEVKKQAVALMEVTQVCMPRFFLVDSLADRARAH